MSPLQNIDELREFVERVFTQEPPESRDAWIVCDFEEHSIALVHVHHLRPTILRVAHHGPEFVAPEDAPLFADALRGIEHRPTRLEFDCNCDHEKKREEYEENCAAKKKVQHSFEDKAKFRNVSPCSGMVGNWPMYSMGLSQASPS